MDAITEIQQQLTALCAHFYATVGTLQRDAPPVTVAGETLLAPSHGPSTVTQDQLQTMAAEVVKTAQSIDRLVKQLPDSWTSEEAQYAQIRTLQRQHRDASDDLEQTLILAKQQLSSLQDSFAELADQQIQNVESG